LLVTASKVMFFMPLNPVTRGMQHQIYINLLALWM
jgi:hypothetical protein